MRTNELKALTTRSQESLLDLIHRELNSNNDQLEAEVYQLNPLLALTPGPLPIGTEVIQPDTIQPIINPIQEFWN